MSSEGWNEKVVPYWYIIIAVMVVMSIAGLLMVFVSNYPMSAAINGTHAMMVAQP